MKLNFHIEDDAELRKTVRELISGQVRAVLREELQDIVKGEIAKLRLSDPSTSSLTEQIRTELEKCVRQTFHASREFANIKDTVAKEITLQTNDMLKRIQVRV